MAAENPASCRLFFALWPSADIADQLHVAARAAHAGCGGRTMRRETLHVTLAFLGSVAAGRVVDAEAAAARVSIPAFELELDRLGYWKHNCIVWAGCSAPPPALLALAAALTQELRAEGFVLDERPFAAHATLLRNARCATAPLPANPIRWPASDFALVESHAAVGGSRYEVRRRWPLAMPLRLESAP